MKAQIELIDQSGREDLALPSVQHIQRIADCVWDNEAVKDHYEISVLYCNDEDMKRYNKQYRGSNSITDVLSFSEVLPGVDGSYRSYLCDIIIDINYISANKGLNEFYSSLDAVFVHALLHLLGYDHMNTKEKEIMETKEQYYLQEIRGLDQSGRR